VVLSPGRIPHEIGLLKTFFKGIKVKNVPGELSKFGPSFFQVIK
jgi:hypothetical protein